MLRKADRRVSQRIRLAAYQTTHYCIRFRVEYRLFSLGEALPPVITTLGQWREAHRPQLERVLAATVPTEPAPTP